MAMAGAEIVARIKAGIPDAEVTLTDLAGDDNHWAAHVVSAQFVGKTRVAQAGLCRNRGGHGRRSPRLATDHGNPHLRRRGALPMSDTNARIAEIVNSNDVVLFMKGTPLFPQCGFSSRAVAILEHLGVPYEGVDVLQDMEIRQGIKAYSDWPTIPQLYVKGEFVGGSDIMMEMYEAGELQQLMTQSGLTAA